MKIQNASSALSALLMKKLYELFIWLVRKKVPKSDIWSLCMWFSTSHPAETHFWFRSMVFNPFWLVCCSITFLNLAIPWLRITVALSPLTSVTLNWPALQAASGLSDKPKPEKNTCSCHTPSKSNSSQHLLKTEMCGADRSVSHACFWRGERMDMTDQWGQTERGCLFMPALGPCHGTHKRSYDTQILSHYFRSRVLYLWLMGQIQPSQPWHPACVGLQG